MTHSRARVPANAGESKGVWIRLCEGVREKQKQTERGETKDKRDRRHET